MGYHHNPALLNNLYRELCPLEKVMELSSEKDGEQASSAPVTVVTIEDTLQ